MIHHDHRDYDVAVDETAKRFKAQLEETIHASQGSALSVIERVTRETPLDRMAHSQSLAFAIDGTTDAILVGPRNRRAAGHFQEPLHKNALDQIAAHADIPGTYVTRLLGKPYGRELLVENLTTIFAKEPDRNLLVRSVDGQVRGVLSNSYKRMDSGPIIDAFAKACLEIGAVPVEGVGGDLRWAIKAILPMVFQPSKKQGTEELIAFGIQLSNSDYGKGALSLRAFMTRIICTNYATMEEVFRERHLGSRLTDNIEYSRETLLADTKVQVLSIRDQVRDTLAPPKVNELVGRIGKTLEARIDPKEAWKDLTTHGLLKGEVAAVKELFNDAGVEQLPPGTTTARLSNAVSWFAKSAATPERRLELENVAGALLFPKKKAEEEKEAA